MNPLNEDSDDYRAGYLAGHTDRQAEIETLNGFCTQQGDLLIATVQNNRL